MYNISAEVGEFCVNRVFNPLSHLHGWITQKDGLCCRGDHDDEEEEEDDDDDDDDDGEDVFLMDEEGDHDGNYYESSLWIRWVPNERRRKIR